MNRKLKVTLERSVAGCIERQRATVRALGLHKRGSSHVLQETPQLNGMLRVVKHLVKVEEVKTA